MSVTILDTQDCMLVAQAQVMEWEQEFMLRYYEPLVKAMINQAIQGAQRSPMIDQQKLDGMLSPQGQNRLRGM